MAEIEELPDDTEVQQEKVEETADQTSEQPEVRQTQNRNEKKARKALSKFGLTQYDKVIKVVVKKQNQVLFVVNNPDVLKNPTSDTFVVFGPVSTPDEEQALAKASRAFSMY